METCVSARTHRRRAMISAMGFSTLTSAIDYPMIIVTAMGNERVAAEAIHRGVAEYVPKTHSFWDQLPGVVQRVARLAQAEEDLQVEDVIHGAARALH